MQEERLQTIVLRIAVDRYHFLKFILEGYDGLAVLTKLQDDKVVLRYPRGMHKDLLQLLSSLAATICSSCSANKNDERRISI